MTDRPMADYMIALNVLVDGKPVNQYKHDGCTYVALEEGQNFELAVRLPNSERFEIVASVDGRDVITGKDASPTARGYIMTAISPPIAGFRLNDQEVAKFEVTKPEASYAAQMGDASNVGVIGLVVYREQQRVLRGGLERFPRIGSRDDFDSGFRSSGRQSFGGGMRGVDLGEVTTRSASQGLGHDVGTGFGARSEDRVSRTHFNRGPEAARIIIQYASRERLMEAGIIKNPPLGEVNPFPAAATSEFCQPPSGWQG